MVLSNSQVKLVRPYSQHHFEAATLPNKSPSSRDMIKGKNITNTSIINHPIQSVNGTVEVLFLSLPTMPFGFNFNLFNPFKLINNKEDNTTRTTKRNVITFEEGLETLQKGIVKLFNILEGSEPNFTPDEPSMLYKTVKNLCSSNATPGYDQELYNLYKETCEDYIKSKVLPSLQEKQDEPLLSELLERWSAYKTMTKCLTIFFRRLDKSFRLRFELGLPNLEETSFLSFYHLVYEEMNQQIMDAIFAMIDRKLAGENVEIKFVFNTLDFSLKFDEYTRKNRTKEEEKMDYSLDLLLKRIILISSDGAMFEVDYGLALMSKRFESIIKTIPVGDVGTIVVRKVSSEILIMVLNYCKMHNHKNGVKDFELKDFDAELVNVDPKTLYDLYKSACYLRVEGLLELTSDTIETLGKGKTIEEISKIFEDVIDNELSL